MSDGNTGAMVDILVVLFIVLLAVWLGLAYSPFFWLILILAVVWLFSRRGRSTV